MPINILMPALSPTMTEGNLSRWLKKEGDMVKPGQVIAEIETDKATMEVEAVDEGKIGKIIVPAGTQGVKVNELIAILLEAGESDVGTAPAATAAPNKMAQAAAPEIKLENIPAATPMPQPTAANGTRIFASPLAKRLAEQKSLDLKQIKGSGPHGRIIKDDVTHALSNNNRPAAAKTSASAPANTSMPMGVNAIDYATKLGMEFDLVPNSMVRKVIAKRLTESKQTVPHFYLSMDCQIDRLLDLRKQLNETIDGLKVSVNDFIIKGVAIALRQVPAANASWADEGILIYKNVDISIAVATPTGLITPIIKKADGKSLQHISSEMKDLAARAKDNKLKPEEFMGGGFSISNLGMFGVKQFAAIINPPQGCILAVGAGEQRPVVKDGQVGVATVMTVTLSVDHRVVDGAVGAEFLSIFKKLIEEPIRLFAYNIV
jgi:pyruvate dehydrogenase E2 component (dihydrolipoamide acetyltransferase)